MIRKMQRAIERNKSKLQKIAVGACVLGPMAAMAQAPTDIAGVTTTVGGYFTAALAAIGVPLLLWQVGKRVFKRST